MGRSSSCSPLGEDAALFGLRVDAIRRTSRGIFLDVAARVARADETFLSEAAGWPVFLSGIERGNAFRMVEIDDEVLERWERTGLFPVTLIAAARRPR